MTPRIPGYFLWGVPVPGSRMRQEGKVVPTIATHFKHFLIPRNEPGCPGEFVGKVVPTIATHPKDFLMPGMSPGTYPIILGRPCGIEKPAHHFSSRHS